MGAEIGLSFKLNIGSTDSFRLGLNLKLVGMNPLNVMVKKPTCDFGQNEKNWNVGWSLHETEKDASCQGLDIGVIHLVRTQNFPKKLITFLTP